MKNNDQKELYQIIEHVSAKKISDANTILKQVLDKRIDNYRNQIISESFSSSEDITLTLKPVK